MASIIWTTSALLIHSRKTARCHCVQLRGNICSSCLGQQVIRNNIENIWMLLCKSVVCPHVEYYVLFWLFHLSKDLTEIESDWRQLINMLQPWEGFHSLKMLGLFSLEINKTSSHSASIHHKTKRYEGCKWNTPILLAFPATFLTLHLSGLFRCWDMRIRNYSEAHRWSLGNPITNKKNLIYPLSSYNNKEIINFNRQPILNIKKETLLQRSPECGILVSHAPLGSIPCSPRRATRFRSKLPSHRCVTQTRCSPASDHLQTLPRHEHSLARRTAYLSLERTFFTCHWSARDTARDCRYRKRGWSSPAPSLPPSITATLPWHTAPPGSTRWQKKAAPRHRAPNVSY